MNLINGRKNAIALTLMMLTLILLQSAMAQERVSKVYQDSENDVLADPKKGPLDRLMDLGNLDDNKAGEFEERKNVDIGSLKIVQDSTYFSCIITVRGSIENDRNYTYFICGYTRSDPDETETFDFIMSYSGGETAYTVWDEGSYVKGGNISLIKIEGATINLTMNRNNFILGTMSEEFLLCSIVVMYPGEGQDRYIDYVMTRQDNDGPIGLDSNTLMIMEIVFIGLVVITTFILWNFWAKRKGVEQQGGVCPKCEARLDQNLDFCPHCGTFVRGPEADKENPKPRIVSPLDIEKEE
ncbi:MAG: zinc ribbon domain-containing protein [Candidatus Thermoplasmatota archaeon]|nr:zinc ribbon domain-containing protein [Candidatus Thermoplasmatota archaeon]